LERLLQTSAGVTVVDFTPDSPVGFVVTIAAYDDEGWETARHFWTELSEHAALEEFLGQSIGIGDEEAYNLMLALRYEWLVEYEMRAPWMHGKVQRATRYFPTFVAWMVLICLLAAWGVVLTAWLLATRVLT